MKKTSVPSAGGERVITAVVPAATRKGRPAPPPVPALPTFRLHDLDRPGDLLLGMARLDPSGRLSARGLFRALKWSSGHRVDLDVLDGAVVVFGMATGRHAVGDRGELGLPASARQMIGISQGTPVVLAASVAQDVLVIHPSIVVARLLSDLHTRLARLDDGR